MSKACYYWRNDHGEVCTSRNLEKSPPPCPVCGGVELSPLGHEDLAPPSFHGADPDRVFLCSSCQCLFPLRPTIRLPGFLLTTLPPILTAGDRKEVMALMGALFQQSHHPWRQLMEREARYPDYRLAELPDLRQALELKGELGGGVACESCGKKPLMPHPAPDQESYFTTTVKIYFPCSACPACNLHRYTWDPESKTVQLETEDASDCRKQVEFLLDLQEKLIGDDLTAFWALALPHKKNTVMKSPAFARIMRAARLAAGASPPEAAMPMDASQPLLRRLGDASPLFHTKSWSVTCQEKPALRMEGTILQRLIREIQAKATDSGPASILGDLARWNQELPFLIKTPPVMQVLGQALVDLRRKIREAGVHLLPIAAREGVVLIDPRSGEVHHHLPHMQANDIEPPLALGFINRMIYYQEPGELSITAHPLIAGTAWRTSLETPLLGWTDLGRYTVMQSEEGLSELSGRSGKVRWSRKSEELGGILEWTIQDGHLVAAGAETLFVVDPGTGEVLHEHPLPKRSTFVKLVEGDLPAPVAVIDQGYGPGIFAPSFEGIKGVKPIAVPEQGSDQLAFVLVNQGQVYSLWETDVGFSDRNILCAPIEKKFAAKGCLLETALAQTPQLLLHAEGQDLILPGNPVAVIQTSTGEVAHLLKVDGTLGVRDFQGTLLAFGKDTVAGLDSLQGKVLWQLDLPGVQATDMPGPQMTPLELRPGFQAPEDTGVDLAP